MKTKLTQTIQRTWVRGLLPCLLLALYLTSTAHAADGTPIWTNSFSLADSTYAAAHAVAVDSSDNVIVAGESFSADNTYDYATIKYSGAGVPLWTNTFSGAGNGDDYANSMAVDSSGNVFVTGGATGSGGNFDYATIKYSGAGVPLWTNTFSGAGNGDDYANSMGVDSSGNVFVTGGATGSGGNFDYATIKYSGAGVPLWTNVFNGAANSDDLAYAMAVDGSGNVLVTGRSYGGSGSGYDYATIKYSGAGAPLWTNVFNGAGNGVDFANAVAVDGSGNVIVTGRSYSGSGSGYDYATIKYSGAGVPLWTNTFNGAGNGYDQANSVAVDGSGNVFVTGYSTGSGSGYDYATIKYSGAGVPLWTNVFNSSFGNGDDKANAMAVDGSGNVFVTGSSYSGSFYDGFGSSPLTGYATIKYSGAGVPLWTNTFSAAYINDVAVAASVDGGGNVIVTGQSASAGFGPGFSYFATIKYSGVPPFKFSTVSGSLGFAGPRFYFTLTGPEGSNAVISASTNLLHWTPLVTNPLTGGSLMFTDAVATNFPSRFYRANLP